MTGVNRFNHIRFLQIALGNFPDFNFDWDALYWARNIWLIIAEYLDDIELLQPKWSIHGECGSINAQNEVARMLLLLMMNVLMGMMMQLSQIDGTINNNCTIRIP